MVRVGDRRAQPVLVEPEVWWVEPHGNAAAARHRDRRAVRVVERLERDDLVTLIDERQHRGCDRLGGSGGDEHLGVGVEV